MYQKWNRSLNQDTVLYIASLSDFAGSFFTFSIGILVFRFKPVYDAWIFFKKYFLSAAVGISKNNLHIDKKVELIIRYDFVQQLVRKKLHCVMKVEIEGAYFCYKNADHCVRLSYLHFILVRLLTTLKN